MNERKLFQKNTKNKINEDFKEKSAKRKYNEKRNSVSLGNRGITLIALVISIIVMLILAGVSLNAVIGDNGIITQAQNATYMQSIAVLEEFIQNQYINEYDKYSEDESKVVNLSNLHQDWFYIPANEGFGVLRYITDADGNALYLIKKSGLPEDIKNQIRGGEAGKGEYTDYASLNDVYGVTSNLKVYYCSGDKDKILGISREELDIDNPNREVLTKDTDSKLYELLSDFDIADATGNKDGILTVEEIKSVKNLTITKEDNITDFSNFYNLTSLQELTLENINVGNLNGIENCSQLNKLYFKGCIIENYNAVGKLGDKLNYLYFYNIEDSELSKICSKDTGIGNYDLNNLKYLAVVGNEAHICDNIIFQGPNVNPIVDNKKSTNTITSLEPFENLSEATKKAVLYFSLQNNNITDKINSNKVEKYALESIKDFTNVTLLRVEYNKLTSLKGLEGYNNLVTLVADANDLGKYEQYLGKDENNNNKDDGRDLENNALQALENKSTLKTLTLTSNNNLIWVDYLKSCNSISELVLKNCSKINDTSIAEIKSIIQKCGERSSYESKYWLSLLDENTKVLNLNNQTITENQLLALKTYKAITHLNLEKVKIKNEDGTENLESSKINEKLNEVLGELTNLKFLNLNSISALSSIEFVKTSGSNLLELDLMGTSVKTNSGDTSQNGLELLNTYAPKLGSILLDNPKNEIKYVQPLVNKVSNNGSENTSYWRNRQYGWIEAASKNYEGCTEITKILWYNYNIHNIDFSPCTSVKFLQCVGNNYKLSSSVEKFYGLGCSKVSIPTNNSITYFHVRMGKFDANNTFEDLCKELSKCTKLQTLEIKKQTGTTMDLNYFSLLSNLSNLTTLSIGHQDVNQRQELSNFAGITNLQNLKTLYCIQSNCSEITWVSKLTNLRNLYIYKNNISSLNGIENLTNLEVLNANTNNISALKPIENLNNLVTLNLQNNCIYDESSYVENGNNIKYRNLDLIRNLNNKNLKNIYLSGNDGITDYSSISKLNWADKDF